MWYLRFTTLFSQTVPLGTSCDPMKDAHTFFGLTPWYRYLPGQTDAFGKCVATLRDWNDLWLIGLAIMDSLLKVAGMVAIGFVIFGGFQYMTSSGEPDKTKKAKDTILNALIGLVIAILATALVSFIGARLG